MHSDRGDRSAYVADKILETEEAITSLMALVCRLDLKGFDTTDAKDRLARLEHELEAWRSMMRSIEERL